MAAFPPKLIAYVDEAGCAGSKYGAGSSHFLVIASAIVSADRESQVLCLFDEARHELRTDKKFKKFSKSNDKENHVFTKLISKKPTRLVQVALHKPSMTGKFTRDHHKEEYQYLAKMVLERVSWLAKGAAKRSGQRGGSSEPNDNLCQIVFSEQKLVITQGVQVGTGQGARLGADALALRRVQEPDSLLAWDARISNG